MTENVVLPQPGFMRLPAILKLIPVGKTTWWNGVKSGRFPKGVKLGERTTAWRVEDIQALMNSFQGALRVGGRIHRTGSCLAPCASSPIAAA